MLAQAGFALRRDGGDEGRSGAPGTANTGLHLHKVPQAQAHMCGRKLGLAHVADTGTHAQMAGSTDIQAVCSPAPGRRTAAADIEEAAGNAAAMCNADADADAEDSAGPLKAQPGLDPLHSCSHKRLETQGQDAASHPQRA